MKTALSYKVSDCQLLTASTVGFIYPMISYIKSAIDKRHGRQIGREQ